MVKIVTDTLSSLPLHVAEALGIPIYTVPPAIVVHAGPGVLVAGFFAARA